MNDRIAVGTPVTVIDRSGTYLSDYGMTHDDLVVLADQNPGYGIGPAKNVGGPAHNRDGWIYFSADEVTVKPSTRLPIGTPVTVSSTSYASHERNDLVVLAHVNSSSYGIGPEGNDSLKANNSTYGWLFYEGSTVHPKQDTPKAKDSKVTKFNVGDKVRVKDSGKGKTIGAWVGVEGIVQGPGIWGDHYSVKLTDPKTTRKSVGYLANLGSNLELVEEPVFTFTDIQEGDTIRRTQTFKGGATEVREGVAAIKGSYYWASAEGNYILAYDTDDKKAVVTLELLNRPEPVKEVWEDAKVLTRKYPGEKSHDTLVRDDDGSWTIHYASGVGTFRVGSSEKLTGYLVDTEVKVLVKA